MAAVLTQERYAEYYSLAKFHNGAFKEPDRKDVIGTETPDGWTIIDRKYIKDNGFGATLYEKDGRRVIVPDQSNEPQDFQKTDLLIATGIRPTNYLKSADAFLNESIEKHGVIEAVPGFSLGGYTAEHYKTTGLKGVDDMISLNLGGPGIKETHDGASGNFENAYSIGDQCDAVPYKGGHIGQFVGINIPPDSNIEIMGEKVDPAACQYVWNSIAGTHDIDRYAPNAPDIAGKFLSTLNSVNATADKLAETVIPMSSTHPADPGNGGSASDAQHQNAEARGAIVDSLKEVLSNDPSPVAGVNSVNGQSVTVILENGHIYTVNRDSSWEYQQTGKNGEAISGKVNPDGSYTEQVKGADGQILRTENVHADGSWTANNYENGKLVNTEVVDANGQSHVDAAPVVVTLAAADLTHSMGDHSPVNDHPQVANNVSDPGFRVQPEMTAGAADNAANVTAGSTTNSHTDAGNIGTDAQHLSSSDATHLAQPMVFSNGDAASVSTVHTIADSTMNASAQNFINDHTQAANNVLDSGFRVEPGMTAGSGTDTGDSAASTASGIMPTDHAGPGINGAYELHGSAADVNIAGLKDGYDTLGSMYDLASAMQHGNYASAFSSGVGLLTQMGKLADISQISGGEEVMSDIGAVGGVLSIANSFQGLSSGDLMTQMKSAGNLVTSLDSVFSALNEGEGFLSSGAAAGIGFVTSAISLVQAFDSGDPASIMRSSVNFGVSTYTTFGTEAGTEIVANAGAEVGVELGAEVGTELGAEIAVEACVEAGLAELEGALACMGPYGWAAAVVVAIAAAVFGDSLFGGGDAPPPPPPPPTGEGHFVRHDDGTIGIEVHGANGGYAIIQDKMTAILADFQHHATESGMEVVAERLPSLSLVSWTSYSGGNYFYKATFADPATGAEKMIAYPEADIVAKMTPIAGYAEGFVKNWEAQQIDAKHHSGDAHYAETEGQYAHRMSATGDTNALIDSQHQTMTALVVDMNGKNVSTIASPDTVGKGLNDIQHDGVARFDADDDGYREATGWVKGNAFLTIDRNGNGVIDDARELLSGRNVAQDIRGGELLKYFDTNHDNVLDAKDPAFAALKVWADINGNGVSEKGAVSGLADLHVASIDLNTMIIHFTDGSTLNLKDISLTAERDGVAVSKDAHTGNVVVQAENGVDGKGTDAKINYVVQADDLSQLVKLIDPNAHLSDQERKDLTAFAEKYGLDPNAEDFAHRVEGLITPETTHESIKVKDGDVISDKPPELEPVHRETHEIKSVQSNLTAAQATAIAEFSKYATVEVLSAISDAKAAPEPVHRMTQEFKSVDSDQTAEQAAAIEELNKSTTEVQSATSDAKAAPEPVQMTTHEIKSVQGNQTAAQTAAIEELSKHVSTEMQSATSDAEAVAEPVQRTTHGIDSAQSDQTAAITESDKRTTTEVQSATSAAKAAPEPDQRTASEVESAESDETAAEESDKSAPTEVQSATSDAKADNTRNGAAETTKIEKAVSKSAEKKETEARVAIYVTAEDLTSEPMAISAGTQRTIANIIAAARNDPSGLFTGTSAGLMALAIGAGAVPIYVQGETTNSASADSINDLPAARPTVTIDYAISNPKLPQFTALVETTDYNAGGGQITESGTLGTAYIITADNRIIIDKAVSDPDTTLSVGPDLNRHEHIVTLAEVTSNNPSEHTSTNETHLYGKPTTNDHHADLPPVLTPDNFATYEDSPITLTAAQLIADDHVTSDGGEMGRNRLTLIGVENAHHGTVGINTDGTITFSPDANYNGEADFQYTAIDNTGKVAQSTVDIEIAPVNDKPVANGETIGIKEEDITIIPLDGVSTHDTYAANGETIHIHEDDIVVIPQAVLLANDSDVDIATNGDGLHIGSVFNAQHGTVALFPSGGGEGGGFNIVFTPDANFNGTAGFDYTVQDSEVAQSTAHATIEIASINDAPVAVSERMNIDEDQIAVIPQAVLLANDKDVDIATNSDVLHVESAFNAQHGTVAIDADHHVVFTPDANFNGTAGFDYTIQDSAGAQSTTHSTIEIASVNDPSIATGETINIDEDQMTIIPQAVLLANDTDVDITTNSDVLHLESVFNAQHGTVALSPSGGGEGGGSHIVFTPDADFSGTAGFDYTVQDSAGAQSTGHTTIEIAPVNDAPVATGETINIDEDHIADISQAVLLKNDTDVDIVTNGDALHIESVSNAEHGTVALSPSGGGEGGGSHIIFTPGADFNGTAGFDYTVQDSHGAQSMAHTTIEIAPVNDPPVVIGETINIDEDNIAVIQQDLLLANDTDVEMATNGDALHIESVSNAEHGMVALSPSGEGEGGSSHIVFTPDADFNGTAGFDYTVQDSAGAQSTGHTTIEIASVNDAPVATGETINIDEDHIADIPQAVLLKNDTDVDIVTNGDALHIESVSNAEHGMVAVDADHHLIFTPDADFNGTAGFDYTIQDSAGVQSTAHTTIEIALVNDAPVATGETINIDEDHIANIPQAILLANDTDVDITTNGDVLHIESVSNAQHCTVVIDADHHVVFTPDADFNGTAGFDYTIQDTAGVQSTAHTAMGIAPVNDAPVATGETINIDEDHIADIPQMVLLKNDIDADIATNGDVLHVESVSNAQHGTVAIDADHDVVFTPDADFNGTAGFDYVVQDSAGEQSIAHTTIEIAAVDDAPIATGETININEDNIADIPQSVLLKNDTDVDIAINGDVLHVESVSNAEHGIVAIDANNHIIFTPDANFNGTAGFDYTVQDSAGGQSIAHTTIEIAPVNDAPVATGETLSSIEQNQIADIPQSVLLANDMDVDIVTNGDSLHVDSAFNAQHGTVAFDANKHIIFTPDADFKGTAGFDYALHDTRGAESIAHASIKVTAVNHAPVVVNVVTNTNEDEIALIRQSAMLDNAIDPDIATDGDVLHVESVFNAQHGTVALSPSGGGEGGGFDIVFTPVANYNGTAGFDFTVQDSHGAHSTAHMTIGIAPVNDAPIATGETIIVEKDRKADIAQAVLLANDTDVDIAAYGDSLHIGSVFNAQHGTVALSPYGGGEGGSSRIMFTPDAGFKGTAGFDYTVQDSAGAQSTAHATIEVVPVNHAPVAVNENFYMNEDGIARIYQSALLDNAVDPDIATDGDVLNVASVFNAQHGTVAMSPSGGGAGGGFDIVFTPDADYNGIAGFDFTVQDSHGASSSAHMTIGIAPVNDQPVATGETLQPIEENQIGNIPQRVLLQNDTDPDIAINGDSLHISSVFNAQHGTVAFGTNNEITFTPNFNFIGMAGFGYTVQDSMGAQSSAYAAIEVKEVNHTPVAVDVTMTPNMNEDVNAFIYQSTLLAKAVDPDIANGDALHVASVYGAQHGTVSFDANHDVVFVPDANYYGSGTAAAGFDFTVQDSHGAQSLPAHMTININPVNDNPTAVGEWDHTDGKENVPLQIPFLSILQNDTDVDGDTVQLYQIISQSHGTTHVDWANHNITFTPETNFVGTASFDYQITDGHGGYAQATTKLDINYSPPVAHDDPISVQEDGGATDYHQSNPTVIMPSALLGNDSLSAAHISWVGNVTNCTVSLQDDGSISYTSPQEYSGSASFQYQASDDHGGTSNIANVLINVTAVNDAPVVETVEYGIPTFCWEYIPAQYDIGGDILVPAKWTEVTDQNTALAAFQIGHAVASSGSTTPILPHYYADGSNLIPLSLNELQTSLPNGDSVPNPCVHEGRVIAWDHDSNSMSYQIVEHSLHGTDYMAADLNRLGVPSSGNPQDWIFNSTSGDQYSGPAPFTVRVTDTQGAYTDVQINVTHYGTSSGGGGKPVALDLDHDGLEFVGINDSKIFYDINGDGWREHIAWTNADDGLLALDAHGDAVIRDADQISFVGYTPGAHTDLEGLQAFDTNHIGKLDANDQDWSKFGVWQDKNQNGICDPGEFHTLSEMGITAINLTSDGKMQVQANGDVILSGTTTYEKADGTSVIAGDAVFRYTNETQPTATMTDSSPSPQSSPTGGEEATSTTILSPLTGEVQGDGESIILSSDGHTATDRTSAAEGSTAVHSAVDVFAADPAHTISADVTATSPTHTATTDSSPSPQSSPAGGDEATFTTIPSPLKGEDQGEGDSTILSSGRGAVGGTVDAASDSLHTIATSTTTESLHTEQTTASTSGISAPVDGTTDNTCSNIAAVGADLTSHSAGTITTAVNEATEAIHTNASSANTPTDGHQVFAPVTIDAAAFDPAPSIADQIAAVPHDTTAVLCPADPAHLMSDAELARLMNQFISDCAGVMIQPPSDVSLPPLPISIETMLAENVLHEFMDKPAPAVQTG
ncbi:MAG: hypothetical protein CSYNP_00304 [Syntrophus sp. SKADARSKE-3]|nr:hypothetical protein [Syntrophus sp. SKADARSKE-3]